MAMMGCTRNIKLKEDVTSLAGATINSRESGHDLREFQRTSGCCCQLIHTGAAVKLNQFGFLKQKSWQQRRQHSVYA
jgi:hypothetical protein